MNSKLVIGCVSLVILILVGVIASSSNDDDTALSTTTDSSMNQQEDMSALPVNLSSVIQTAIASQSEPNVVILDVRTDAEWNEQYAVGAVHFGLAEHLENGEMPDLERDMEIYVYCRSGNRSGQAIRIMQEAGFTNLTNIGGLDDWVEAGGETTSGVDSSDQ